MKEKFIQLKNQVTPYWKDPVWSKVIAAAIIASSVFVGGVLWATAKSRYSKVSFKVEINKVIIYFQGDTKVNNLIFWLVVIFLIWVLISFSILIVAAIKKALLKQEENDDSEELPSITEDSISFFSYRISKAFPGQRGLQWYDSKTAVQRLSILLKAPLTFKPSSIEVYMSQPIWWFRGGSSLDIKLLRTLSKTKVLMSNNELEIKRIAVFVGNTDWKSFIYVEINAEPQTGLYNYSMEDIQDRISSMGYCAEEYGLLNKIPIHRQEYDDGAAVINGKVVDAGTAELRIRYLSSFNFVVAAKQSPLNSARFCKESREKFDSFLAGELPEEDFLAFLQGFDRNEGYIPIPSD